MKESCMAHALAAGYQAMAFALLGGEGHRLF